jgi:hypothetical protein
MLAAMDLSRIEELVVMPEAPDRVRLRWRHGETWESFVYVDEDTGYADDEDILLWLLRYQAPLELVRTALAVSYPEFDVDRALDFVTMPDGAERRAEDRARRAWMKEQFRANRDTTQ